MGRGGDGVAETVAFGQRVRVLRVRRGMSREVLAGLVGRSASWVKQIEGGRLQMPKPPMVLRLAKVLRVGAEGSRQAAAADTAALPSRPRRARHHIERARAYQLDGRPEESVTALALAYEAAPETIRYNGYARRILLEESAHRSPQRRRRAARLATRIGVMPA
ncbi:helix-turn-helix domain-containing protein [Streptomyces reniochalinae]|uniref:XRE family transcriptional regulator n=1 Tax=Streptomyces reniochalinae TaxID=2250578 RepID=A0A367EJ06_9ACTN|nr:helix-turn-helix transcriptional regulator [Streptomyces reniochalinae]RCG18031.1 XRE family transcriptional regulator [Streptomyces reniochalinae]